MKAGRSSDTSKKSSGLIVFIILVVVSLAITTWWYRESETGPLHTVRTAVHTVTTPATHAGNWIFTPFRSIGSWFAGLSTNKNEVADLKKQNTELRAQLMQSEENRKEAARLRNLLDLQSVTEQKSVGAHVIGGSVDDWGDTIVIDKGSRDGLDVGMPVLGAQSKTARGLVGQTVEVGPFSSIVRLLDDPKSGVSAMIQSNRAEGVAQGGSDGKVYLNNIAKSVKVTPGDVVITSGLGGVYPKGIVIGEVSAVDKNASGVYQTILVKPSVDPGSLEEVLVVTGDRKR